MTTDGRASVEVGAQEHPQLRAQLAAIRQTILTGLRQVEQQARVEIQVDADASAVVAELREVGAEAAKLDGTRVDVKVNADTKQARTEIAKTLAEVKAAEDDAAKKTADAWRRVRNSTRQFHVDERADNNERKEVYRALSRQVVDLGRRQEEAATKAAEAEKAALRGVSRQVAELQAQKRAAAAETIALAKAQQDAMFKAFEVQMVNRPAALQLGPATNLRTLQVGDGSGPILGPTRDDFAAVRRAFPDDEVVTRTQRIRQALDGLEKIEAPKLSRFQRHLTLWTVGITAAFGAAGVGIGAFAVKLSADLEQTRIAFSGILGSEAAGGSLVKQLQQFAATTPFEFDQLTGSTQKLLASFQGLDGIKNALGTDLFGTLTAIGDLAATLGRDEVAVERFILALTQMQGKGRIAAEEVRQMAEAFPGFNVYAAIAEVRGISVAEAMEGLREKTIPFDEAMRDLVKGMQQFNGAAGAMERQSQTLAGRLSTVKDQIKITLVDAFEPLSIVTRNFLEDFAVSLSGGPIQSALARIGDTLGSAFARLGPSILPFIETILNVVNILSGDLLRALVPVLDGLSAALPPLARIIGELSIALAEGFAAALYLATPVLRAFAAAIEAIPLPILTGLVSALAGFVFVQSILGPMATFGRLLLILSGGFQALGPAVVNFVAAMRAGTLTMATAGPIIAGLALVIGAAATAYTLFTQGNEQAEQRTRELTGALEEQYRQLLRNKELLESYGNLPDPGEAAFNDVFSGGLLETGEDGEKLAKTLGTLRISTEQLIPTLIKLKGTQDETTGALRRAIESSLEFTGLTDGQKDVIAATVEEYDDLDSIYDQLYNSGIDLTGAQRRVVAALEELQDQAEKTDLEQLARDQLALIAGSDPAAEALVRQAEALTGLSRSGDDATVVYEALLGLLIERGGELPALFGGAGDAANAFEQRVAALGQAGEEAALGLEDVIGTVEGLDSAAANAAEAADALTDALDRLSNPQLDLTQAQIALGEFNRQFEETFKGVAGSGSLLDINSEAGAAAIAGLLQGREVLLQGAAARLNAGEGRQDILNALGVGQAGQIIQLADLINIDPEALRAQLESLGIVIPAEVLLDEASKIALQDDLDALEESNPTIATAIQTLVDQGKYAEAQTILDYLAAERIVPYDGDPTKLEAVIQAILDGDIEKAIKLLGDTIVFKSDVEAAKREVDQMVVRVSADTTDATAQVAAWKRANAALTVRYGASPGGNGVPSGGGSNTGLAMAGALSPFGPDFVPSRFARLGSALGLGVMYDPTVNVTAFRKGGFYGVPKLSSIAPHLVSTPTAKRTGGFVAWAEAQAGEAFISTDPRWRKRAQEVHAQVAPLIGMESIPAGMGRRVADSEVIAGVARVQSTVATDVARRLDRVVRKVDQLVEAAKLMPPITVHHQGDPSGDEIASRTFHAHRNRMNAALART